MLKLQKSRKMDEAQNGFVSIIVAALIMVILSLITIGFTRIMQREQRQALDRQLTRQALYAAESGINDVYSSILSNPSLPAEKSTCDVSGDIGGQPNPSKNSGVIDAAGVVGYTCVLYDKTPTELVYSVGTSESKVFELKNESGMPFNSIALRWANEKQDENDITFLPTCGAASAKTFPPTRTGAPPLIRLDLTNTATLSRDSLINGTDYLYLSPCKNGTPIVNHTFLSPAAKGQIVEVACVSGQSTPCEIIINGLSASSSYVARVRSVYDSAKLTVSAVDTTSSVIQFRQAQTSIDVTAKASDVVRRLRVTLPLVNTEGPPEAVFQAFDGICKLMIVDAVSSPATITDDCNP